MSTGTERVALVTNMPSYHQVDLFNAHARTSSRHLRVFYLKSMTRGRQWTKTREIDHDHVFIRDVALPRGLYRSPGLLRALRRFDPQGVIVTQYSGTGVQSVMYAASALRIPWTFWSERARVDYSDQPTFRSQRTRGLAIKLAQIPLSMWAAEVWGVDSRAADDYRRLGRSVNVMPYYADLSSFDRIVRPGVGAPPRFLYAGKLVERKGVDVLIAAARSLLQNAEQFHLTVTGDGPLREQILGLKASYPHNIDYLGFKEIEEMPEVFGQADVLVCPSRYDGWGMVVPEAMAAGMPVIATRDTGAALEMVSPEVDGWLIESGSVDVLARTIKDAIDSRDSIPSMSEKARKAASSYDAEAGAQHLDELLDGVL